MEGIMGFSFVKMFGLGSIAVRPIFIFRIVDSYKTVGRNCIVIHVFLNQLFYQLIPFFRSVNISIITIPRIDYSRDIDIAASCPILFAGI